MKSKPHGGTGEKPAPTGPEVFHRLLERFLRDARSPEGLLLLRTGPLRLHALQEAWGLKNLPGLLLVLGQKIVPRELTGARRLRGGSRPAGWPYEDIRTR